MAEMAEQELTVAMKTEVPLRTSTELMLNSDGGFHGGGCVGGPGLVLRQVVLAVSAVLVVLAVPMGDEVL